MLLLWNLLYPLLRELVALYTGGGKLPYFGHMGHQLHHMTPILRHMGLYFRKRPHMTKKLIINNSKLSYMYMKKRHMGILLNSSIFSSVIWDHF